MGKSADVPKEYQAPNGQEGWERRTISMGGEYQVKNPQTGQWEDANKGGAFDFKGAAKQTADAQQQAIDRQTWSNRPGQKNAYGGGVQWVQGPDGRWTQQQSFGAGMQGTADSLMGQMGQSLSNLMRDGESVRTQAIDSAFNQAKSRLDPMFAQREEGLQSQLLNQGLDPTSEANQTANANFGRERNDAYTSALADAIRGGNEAMRGELSARMAPLQALQGMGGLLGQQGFNAAGVGGAPDYMRAYENAMQFALGDAAQQNQAWTQGIQGLFSLGSSIPGAGNAAGWWGPGTK